MPLSKDELCHSVRDFLEDRLDERFLVQAMHDRKDLSQTDYVIKIQLLSQGDITTGQKNIIDEVCEMFDLYPDPAGEYRRYWSYVFYFIERDEPEPGERTTLDVENPYYDSTGVYGKTPEEQRRWREKRKRDRKDSNG